MSLRCDACESTYKVTSGYVTGVGTQRVSLCDRCGPAWAGYGWPNGEADSDTYRNWLFATGRLPTQNVNLYRERRQNVFEDRRQNRYDLAMKTILTKVAEDFAAYLIVRAHMASKPAGAYADATLAETDSHIEKRSELLHRLISEGF